MDRTWEYPANLPAGNFRADPAAVPPGFYPELVGVDGRFEGTLRRFPGFKRLKKSTETGPFKDVDFFKYVEIQKGQSTDILRGFLIRWKNFANVRRLLFMYYDTGTQTWTDYLPNTGNPFEGDMDADCSGRFLWIVREGEPGITIYWSDSGSTVVERPLGHLGAVASIPYEPGTTPNDLIVRDGNTLGYEYGTFEAPTAQLSLDWKWERPTGSPDSQNTISNGILQIPFENADLGERVFRISHLIGVRMGDSNRNVWSPIHLIDTSGFFAPQSSFLSGNTAINVAPGQEVTEASDDYNRGGRGLKPNFYAMTAVFPVTAEEAAVYDTVEVYRTINNGSVLYRDIYYHVPTETGIPEATIESLAGFGFDSGVFTPNTGGNLLTTGGIIRIVLGGQLVVESTDFGGADTVYRDWNPLTEALLIGTHSDATLQFQQDYDPVRDDAGIVPLGGRILYVGGANFVSPQLAAAEGEISETWWSSLSLRAPEVFPTSNRYRPAKLSDAPGTYILAGDAVLGVAPTRIYRFQRDGARMTAARLQNGYGIVGRYAVVEVGGDILFIAPSTLLVLNGASGQPTTVGVLERYLNEPSLWGATKSSIFMVHDSQSNAVFIVNKDLAEAFVIWGNTNTLSRLKDMGFTVATSGPHPEEGGPSRAFFITKSGAIVYFDAERQNASPTMMGVEGTLNGTVSADSSGTTVTDSTAAFDTDAEFGGLTDAYLHILSGDSAGLSRQITSNTGTAITLESALSVAAGDRYAISPVPFEVVGWPLGASDDPRVPRVHSRRRKLVAMGVSVDLIGGEIDPDTNPNLKLTVEVYRNKPVGAPLVEAEIDMTEYQTDNFGGTSVSGFVLLPGVKVMSSGVDFAIPWMGVQGDLETSLADQSGS